MEQGLAERRGQDVILSRNLLATLRVRGLQATGAAIESETGLTYRSVTDGENVTGVYRRSLVLASGRFAMLNDGIGFPLVPWRPVVQHRLGQSVSALCAATTCHGNLGGSFGPAQLKLVEGQASDRMFDASPLAIAKREGSLF